MLEKFLLICEEHNYVKPSIYQGEYNLVHRDPEETLLPLLRKHKIHFVAFSPLGGGFLTGKFTAGNAEGTRFGGPLGQRHRQVYDRPDFHNMINELKRIIEPLGISPTGAALRWLAYHSELNEGDGIILGASKIEQLTQNVKDIEQGPLPESVIVAIRAIKGAADA
jgi:aflatoxin B1 aldehyde reductase